MYDLELYKNDLRGFYIDLSELPGPVIEKEEEMISCVKNVDSWFGYDEKYQKFNQKFNYLNDGNASKRLLDVILEE